MRWGLGRDATLLIAGQGVRAAGYGFTAVILGALLADRGYGPLQAGVVGVPGVSRIGVLLVV